MNFNSKHAKIAKAGFEYKCIFILIDGYRLMKAARKYEIDWEEEQITAQLIYFIELSPARKKWKIQVMPEIRNYTNEIIIGEKLPKEASRIDMQMSSWQTENEEVYYIEAKNLCENDWVKEDGSKVSSSNQLNRYINKGVLHFISGYYPTNGCMCGYMLEGNNDKIIKKLNNILANKSLNQLKVAKAINGHSMFYKITYGNNYLLNICFDYR